MKVAIIGSGHEHSTFDLGSYYEQAFKKLNVDVKLIRYDLEFKFALETIGVVRRLSKGDDISKYYGEAIYLASKSALADIVIFNPDIIIVVTGTNIFPQYWDWIHELKSRLMRPPKHAIILTESPYQMEAELEIAMSADCVFTNEQTMVRRLQIINRASHYLRHAYREDVHYKNTNMEKAHDVFFCGSGHTRRLAALSLTDWTGIDLSIFGVFPTMHMNAPHLMEYYTEGTVPNDQVADEYRQSNICLNIHRTTGKRTIMKSVGSNVIFVKHHPTMVHGCHSVNNRTMEIAACGAFQLCDDKRPELSEIFGDSVAVYASAEELSDKTRYYLANDSLREEMARESHRKVQGLTYTNNAKRILAILEGV